MRTSRQPHALQWSVLSLCLLRCAYAGEDIGSLSTSRAVWAEAEPERCSYVVREHTTMVVMCMDRTRALSRNPVRLFVQNGRIARVESVRDGRLPESCLKNMTLHTIDWLFSYIERVQRQQGECGTLPLIEVKYDATFGFPSFVEENCVLDGSSYTVSDFRVLK